MLPETLSVFGYDLAINFFSFAIAVFTASTIYFFFLRQHVLPEYRMALVLTGLVTFIALYHYVQIFLSATNAFKPVLAEGSVTEITGYAATGKPFNDAYRYVDWLLTVPLLLIELILVMRLAPAQAKKLMINLPIAAAVMVILGYPGEIAAGDDPMRWLWWALSMLPFLYIVFTLVGGLNEAIAKQPEEARGLVSMARWLTVFSWAFYPVVFLFPMIGFAGESAWVFVQVGYSVADIVAKAVFGVLIAHIALAKSKAAGYNPDGVASPAPAN